MNKEKIVKALSILVDNGMDKDEAYTVLQALCYVLEDEEIDDYLSDEDYDSL